MSPGEARLRQLSSGKCRSPGRSQPGLVPYGGRGLQGTEPQPGQCSQRRAGRGAAEREAGAPPSLSLGLLSSGTEKVVGPGGSGNINPDALCPQQGRPLGAPIHARGATPRRSLLPAQTMSQDGRLPSVDRQACGAGILEDTGHCGWGYSPLRARVAKADPGPMDSAPHQPLPRRLNCCEALPVSSWTRTFPTFASLMTSGGFSPGASHAPAPRPGSPAPPP